MLREKQGGRRERNFKTVTNVQMFVWLILERLEKSFKLKEIIFYVAKKMELCFGGMRRNVRRV